MTVSVTDENEAPAFPSAVFTGQVVVGAAAGTAAITGVRAVDVDAGDALTYAFSSAVFQSSFALDAATGAVTLTKVLTDPGQLETQVTATDRRGLTASATLRVVVLPPLAILFDGSNELPENTAPGTEVGRFTLNRGTGTFQLTDSADGRFVLDAAAPGVLRVAPAAELDFETTPVLTVRLKAKVSGSDRRRAESKDAELTTELQIRLRDRNDPPAFGLVPQLQVSPTASHGTVVGKVAAEDPDGPTAGDGLGWGVLTHRIMNAEALPFAVNASTGLITVVRTTVTVGGVVETVPLNQTSYDVVMHAADGGGLTATVRFTIGVTNSENSSSGGGKNVGAVVGPVLAVVAVLLVLLVLLLLLAGHRRRKKSVAAAEEARITPNTTAEFNNPLYNGKSGELYDRLAPYEQQQPPPPPTTMDPASMLDHKRLSPLARDAGKVHQNPIFSSPPLSPTSPGYDSLAPKLPGSCNSPGSELNSPSYDEAMGHGAGAVFVDGEKKAKRPLATVNPLYQDGGNPGDDDGGLAPVPQKLRRGAGGPAGQPGKVAVASMAGGTMARVQHGEEPVYQQAGAAGHENPYGLPADTRAGIDHIYDTPGAAPARHGSVANPIYGLGAEASGRGHGSVSNATYGLGMPPSGEPTYAVPSDGRHVSVSNAAYGLGMPPSDPVYQVPDDRRHPSVSNATYGLGGAAPRHASLSNVTYGLAAEPAYAELPPAYSEFDDTAC